MEPGPDSKVAITDSPGLLLYYLFDDWYTSYALVAKKEQQYATRLQALVSIDQTGFAPFSRLIVSSGRSCLSDRTLA